MKNKATIHLFAHNFPKEPGFYIVKRPEGYSPETAEIRQEVLGLEFLSGGGVFPLERLECMEPGTLFSNKLEFEEH